jgi:hypothetical protein
MKATDLLKKDHAEVKKLFAEFDRTGERALTHFRHFGLGAPDVIAAPSRSCAAR